MRVSIALALAITAAILSAAATHLWERRHLPRCPLNPAIVIGDSNVFQMDLGANCMNLGVAGDTTKNMAARFHIKDLAGMGREWLVIWTPSNEVHFHTGDGVRYIEQMAQQGRAAGLHVILITPLPMIDMAQIPPSGHRSQAQVDADIAALSAQVKALGQREGFAVADVHGAVVKRDGSINRAMFQAESDGTLIHLNRAGDRAVWEVIEPIASRQRKSPAG
jgi:lysophospholipase L1-like esterase